MNFSFVCKMFWDLPSTEEAQAQLLKCPLEKAEKR
jgi:hypothetical protein